MWKCISCGWTGETDDLKPATVVAGIQGAVKTSACPKCGKTVGVDVVIDEEDISQEISDITTGIDVGGGEEAGTGETGAGTTKASKTSRASSANKKK